jgi:UDP-N-acetylmuramyl pentapeptide synthase
MKNPVPVTMTIPGRHQASNALAAAAVGLTMGVPPAKIRTALEGFQASSKRMEVVQVGGVTILNDTYNANPESTFAALHTLTSMRTRGKRIAVLGDMLELGAQSAEEHARVGRAVAAAGVDYLLTFGTWAQHIQRAAEMATAVHYDQQNVLAEYLLELVTPGDLVLLKGSRSMKMENILTFLRQRLNTAEPSYG